MPSPYKTCLWQLAWGFSKISLDKFVRAAVETELSWIRLSSNLEGAQPATVLLVQLQADAIGAKHVLFASGLSS